MIGTSTPSFPNKIQKKKGRVAVKLVEIRRVTVVGAGMMGHGIGQDFARAGYDVLLHARREKTLQRAQNNNMPICVITYIGI